MIMTLKIVLTLCFGELFSAVLRCIIMRYWGMDKYEALRFKIASYGISFFIAFKAVSALW